jgi:hypothetical protein
MMNLFNSPSQISIGALSQKHAFSSMSTKIPAF